MTNGFETTLARIISHARTLRDKHEAIAYVVQETSNLLAEGDPSFNRSKFFTSIYGEDDE